jgi:hypothetical protein
MERAGQEGGAYGCKTAKRDGDIAEQGSVVVATQHATKTCYGLLRGFRRNGNTRGQLTKSPGSIHTKIHV